MTSGGRTRRKMGRKQLRVVTVCHTAWNGEAQWYAPKHSELRCQVSATMVGEAFFTSHYKCESLLVH